MSNKEILLDIIGETDEELIPELKAAAPKRRIWPLAGIGAAAVIAAAVVLPRSGLFSAKPKPDASPAISAAEELPAAPGDSSTGEKSAEIGSYTLASAEYPLIPRYPESETDSEAFSNWHSAVVKLRNQPSGYSDGYSDFFLRSSRVFLENTDGKNAVYSPLGLYMALAMTAELTDGTSRQQLLDVLCRGDMDELRSGVRSLWLANYMDDGMAKCLLADSLWLNKSVGSACNTDTLAFVAENYFADTFSGDPSAEDYTKAFQSWLSDRTGGQLDDEITDLKLDPSMILTLASTVDYCGKWVDTFPPQSTETGTFHSAEGDIGAEFMHDERHMDYYWGDRFAAVDLPLENNGSMRLLLPDEGVSPEELLSDSQAAEFMLHTNYSYKDRRFCNVRLSVPKFDVSASFDLREGLEALGVTDIFDSGTADFSPLTAVEGVCVSTAEQDTRVSIDEEGCRAASLTVIGLNGAAAPDGTAVFTLDRPFLFEIISATGQPLFAGVVNRP